MSEPIITLDLHNMTTDEARHMINKTLQSADSSTYRIRLIHGYNRGDALFRMIKDEYEYFGHKKVKRLDRGANPGQTDLVLREY